MLNHVMVGSNDIARSKAFYDAVLAVLGAGASIETRPPPVAGACSTATPAARSA